MRTYGVQDFFNAAKRQRKELQSEIQRAAHYEHVHRGKKAELEREYLVASRELGQALLPDLTRATVDAAVQLTGYSALAHDDVVGQVERQRALLQRRIAEIEADPRYAQRELLTHPRTGSLTRQIAELEPYANELRKVLEMSSHPRLDALLANGYGTPEYAVGFWRLSYYSDWKAGDEILARFPEKQFFHQVRDEVLRARDAIQPISADLDRLRAEIAAIHALDAERTAKLDALASAPERFLRDARARLVDFVSNCPIDAIGPRLESHAAAALQYKRLSAVAAKTRYLDGIIQSTVQETRNNAGAALAKLESDMQKYARPKKANTLFPGDAFERRFRSRQEQNDKRWNRVDRSYVSVYSYDRYDEVSLARDFLWWDVMTHGRYDGRHIPEVRSYYDHHPGYVYSAPEPTESYAAFDTGPISSPTPADDTSPSTLLGDVS